ncbi:MAG: hypothetical protein OEL75_01885 [Kiritimatiellaceae bacterium]|nr:hypothetical protein [Kiritimatiellaceae bacterium]
MRTILQPEYEEILAVSEVFERDGRGVKVMLQPDGNFFKTFFFKRKMSLRRIYPEWLRFSLHAASLKRREIPTVTIVESIRLPHLKCYGVIYRPLEGRTLRQVAAEGEFDGALAEGFGVFLSRLHRQGIHFRSLHLGNVLLCPDGEFGLIDISDMKVFYRSLNVSTRLRNFVHLLRYSDDMRILSEAGIPEFTGGYFQEESSTELEAGVTDLLRKYANTSQ